MHKDLNLVSLIFNGGGLSTLYILILHQVIAGIVKRMDKKAEIENIGA